ncbi:MAG: glycosyltransferase [Pseudomonadota bacterium]
MFDVFRPGLAAEALIDLRFMQRRYGPEIADKTMARALFNERFPEEIIELGRDFDAPFYLAQNEDVRAARINPMDHFLAHGQFEGRRPHADFDRTALLTERGARIRRNLLQYLLPEDYFALSGHDVPVDIDPVMHFFTYGHSMELPLFPAFDAAFYAAQNPEVTGTTAQNHYVFFGHLEGRPANADGTWQIDICAQDAATIEAIRPLMDIALYKSRLDPRIAERVDPAMHYFYFGERAGLMPNRSFDPVWYQTQNPGIVQDGRNAFHHFETEGRAQHRTPNNCGGALLAADTQPAPPPGRAAGYMAQDQDGTPRVSVVIPVYDGHRETLDCIRAAIGAATDVPFEVVVLDDASPNPALSADLAALAGDLGFVYRRNGKNMGFVGTSNIGLRRALDIGTPYILLLNSDTRVYDGWLDAMLEAMESDPAIASATAFSNNATIFSYPHGHDAACHGLEIPQEALARHFSASTAALVDAPTGMGFALMLRAEALAQTGLLDEAAFGRGYGEEVDLCRKLRLAGYRNVCAPRAYVTHYGSISFGLLQQDASAHAQDILDVRYPDYHLEVFDFINSDPFRRIRRDVDTARLREVLQKRPFILSITHDLGGGIDTFCRDFYPKAQDAGLDVIEVRLGQNGSLSLEVRSAHAYAFPNLVQMGMEEGLNLLEDICGASGLRGVFIQSLITLPVPSFPRLRTLLQGLRQRAVRIVYVGHDYQYNCPRANYIDNLATFCGVGSDAKCETCVKWTGHAPGASIRIWRDFFADVIAAADKIVFPDPAGATLFERAFPDYAGERAVVPHAEDHMASLQRPAHAAPPDDPLRLCLIGAIGPHKGSRILRSLAKEAARRQSGIEFHVVGYTDLDMAEFSNVHIHGRYASAAEALDRVDRIDPHLCLDLSIWPETYCYTVSLMIASGRRAACLDIGAQANRFRALGHDVLDYALTHRTGALLDAVQVAATRDTPVPAAPNWASAVTFEHYR